MLSKISIKGYKSIKELELELKPINILIGSNGSGKSNFLSFFEFLENLYKNNLETYVATMGYSQKFLHKGNKVTKNISSIIEFEDNTKSYSFNLQKNEEDLFIFISEHAWYKGKQSYNMASFSSNAKIINDSAFRSGYVRRYLSLTKKYHFHDTGRNSPFNQISNIEKDIYFLESTGRNLAAFLYKILQKNNDTYKFILFSIQSIAPYLLDFFLQPNENGDIKLLWRHKEFEQLMGVTDLSDGTIRFIALAALFLQPDLPQTIIIDEPELGLHPFAISKLAGMIKSVSSQGCQVILATQSVELINYFEAEDIITVDQIDGESYFKRLSTQDLKHWLEDYTLGELWQRNIIAGGQVNY